jgi:uncharacterized protein (TIGR02145 family)
VSAAKATTNYGTYGVLYNWPAAMNGASSSTSVPSNVQGICPPGWHLPSDEEWKVLEKNQGMSQTDANAIELRNSGIVGGKLKEAGALHWQTSTNIGATNTSSFTALPGGYSYSGGFFFLGNQTLFWSASESGTYNAWYRKLSYNENGVFRHYNSRYIGVSVRCLMNN